MVLCGYVVKWFDVAKSDEKWIKLVISCGYVVLCGQVVLCVEKWGKVRKSGEKR